VEIKIKWMIRKDMTYENTYRDDRIASSFFILFLGFFQEETLGDISFKFETKIMNFMTGFVYEKNIIKLKCCQYYALQFVYNFPIIRPLCRVWVCFYWLHHVFQILSVILTNYHYNIYWLPQIQFHIYIS
jgi:hypothetical protein